MKLNKKITLQISLYYALYMVLFSWFFNPFTFLKQQHVFVDLTLCFVVIFFSEWMLLKVFSSSAKYANLIRITSFIISASLAFLMLIILNGIEIKKLLFFYSSFFVLAFLPSLLFLIWNLYTKYEDKLVFEKAFDDSKTAADDIEIQIENENNKLILSTQISQLICFEANDNYVNSYYLDKNGVLKKSMDRLSLKKVEDLLAQHNVAFHRIHKSYLVNSKYLIEVKGRSQAYKIKLKFIDFDIPVSRNYDINVLK